jgi:hypothetical protein
MYLPVVAGLEDGFVALVGGQLGLDDDFLDFVGREVLEEAYLFEEEPFQIDFTHADSRFINVIVWR